VQGALAILLPTEDLENVCLRTLVGDIVGEMILGNGIGGKACEGWLIWEGLTNMVENIRAHLEPKATGKEIEVDTRNRLEKFGLLSEKNQSVKERTRREQSTTSSIFWRILQYAYLTFMALRFLSQGLITASSQPPRSSSNTLPPNVVNSITSPIGTPTEPPMHKRPLLASKAFSLISCLLGLPLRMPWLEGSFSLFQYYIISGPGRLGATDGVLDKFLHALIQTHLLSPSLLPPLLLTLRTSIFPSNALGSPRATPTAAQQAALKRSCARSILSLVPALVAERYFNTRDRVVMEKEVEEVLDVFGDSYLNKHLMYGVVELVLVRLMPELAQKDVGELMEARLGEAWDV